MFEVSVLETFAAGHYLRHYKGKCENPHGHNYRVEVTFAGEAVDEKNGMLADFVDIKRVLRKVVAYLDHQMLNDIEPFNTVNPSAENIAKYFHDEIEKGMANVATTMPVRLHSVRVWETDTCVATYRL